jgi:hypothetical protein
VDAPDEVELDVPTESWKIGARSSILVSSWQRGSTPVHKDSNLSRCCLVPKMLRDQLDNMESLRRSACDGSTLGHESITRGFRLL